MANKIAAIAYLGDLMGGGLLLSETKVLTEVLLTHPTPAEWQRLVGEENILQKNSIHSARRVALAVKNRLEPLGEPFWRDLQQADTETSKQLILFAVLARSKAMTDFMSTVMADARRIYQDELHTSCWTDFIDTRSRSVAGLDSYAESTVIRMGNNVFRMLVDCGYLSEGRSTKKLHKPFVLPLIGNWAARQNRMDVLEAMES
tara:strand:- start:17564 stop:18172 length:609 start_codon:yes stop_codon:yes gene_type:complete